MENNKKFIWHIFLPNEVYFLTNNWSNESNLIAKVIECWLLLIIVGRGNEAERTLATLIRYFPKVFPFIPLDYFFSALCQFL